MKSLTNTLGVPWPGFQVELEKKYPSQVQTSCDLLNVKIFEIEQCSYFFSSSDWKPGPAIT